MMAIAEAYVRAHCPSPHWPTFGTNLGKGATMPHTNATASTHPDRRDERKHPRYEIAAYVDCTGSEVLLHHRLQNISLGGICIQCDTVEEVGTEVDLLIHFPDLGASLALKGEVVWANRSTPRDMGIRFTSLDERKVETLRQYLHKVQRAAASPPAPA